MHIIAWKIVLRVVSSCCLIPISTQTPSVGDGNKSTNTFYMLDTQVPYDVGFFKELSSFLTLMKTFTPTVEGFNVSIMVLNVESHLFNFLASTLDVDCFFF